MNIDNRVDSTRRTRSTRGVRPSSGSKRYVISEYDDFDEYDAIYGGPGDGGRGSGPRNTKNNRKKKKRKKKHYALKIFTILLMLTVSIAALMVYLRFYIPPNDGGESEDMLTGYSTIAVFGIDNRSSGDWDTGNSDSMMLININNDAKSADVISIYRDTVMDMNDDEDTTYNLQKANYAYNHGGVENAIKVLNRNLDLEIDDYVVFDFNAVTKAIDAVGGIELEITQEEVDVMHQMGYIGEVADVVGEEALDIEAGYQTLNGVQATAYCRIRGTAGNDFRRAERQRDVIKALVAKVKESNAVELAKVISAVYPNLHTSFSMSQVMYLAGKMKGYSLGEMHGYPFDYVSTDQVSGYGYAVFSCTHETNVIKLHEMLNPGQQYEPSSAVQEISREIRRQSGFDEGDAQDYGY